MLFLFINLYTVSSAFIQYLQVQLNGFIGYSTQPPTGHHCSLAICIFQPNGIPKMYIEIYYSVFKGRLCHFRPTGGAPRSMCDKRWCGQPFEFPISLQPCRHNFNSLVTIKVMHDLILELINRANHGIPWQFPLACYLCITMVKCNTTKAAAGKLQQECHAKTKLAYAKSLCILETGAKPKVKTIADALVPPTPISKT